MRRYTANLSHLISLILCLFLGLSLAQAEEISFVLNGSPIPGISVDPLNGHTVFDNESYSAAGNSLSPTNNFNDLTNRNVISAWIDMEEPTFQPDAYRYDIILFVEFLDGSGNPQNIGYDTLSLTFDPNANTTFDDRAFLTFENGYYTTAKILDIIEYDAAGALTHIQTAPDWIMFDMRIEVERYYDFNRQLTPSINTVSSNNGMIDVSWNYSGIPASIPESYDLEWTFVDDYGVSSMEYDFSEYAVRVNVPASQNSYQLEDVFTGGFLIFRVRAVGRISSNISQRQEGFWSSPPGEVGTISTGPQPVYVFNTLGHEESINWRYQVTYIEEGKHKGVISYHDGSLRGRQTVTRLSEEGVAMIAETVYDYEGRPAIQFLPTPNFYDTGSTPSWDFDEEIKYYDGVNLASSNNPYSWSDFEVEQMNAICDPVTVAADNSSGAARYYSSSNPMTSNQAAHIPDAGGYPFVQTEYTADNTGRIRKQGGVGPDHQIDGEHASTYFYTVPAQKVLNALFGTNVGYAEHYRKTVVLDPNGQASVTYLDPYGRTIATALAGDVPDNVTALPNYKVAIDLTIDLAEKSNTRDGNSIVSAYNHHVLKKSDHTFTYKLDAATFESNCDGVAFCYDCVYEFEFLIQDSECGEIITTYSQLLGPSGVLDNACNANQYVANIPVVELEPGEYLITKKLTVQQESLDAYAEMYFEDNSCLKTEEDFYQEFLADVDFSMCEDDACSYECEMAYGRNAQEYADLGYTGSYSSAMEACFEECNTPPSMCESWKTFMMQQVSPGGKYAWYELDDGSFNEFVGAPNVIDGVSYYSVLDHVSQGLHYKKPTLTYDPASIDIDGVVTPVTTLTVSQFIDNWQPSWAETLIELHPDYCSYQKICAGGLLLDDSYSFDTELQLLANASEAQALSYINVSVSASSDLLSFANTPDPFFQGNSNAWTTFHAGSIADYRQTGYSMLEIATILALCGDQVGSQATLDACLLSHPEPFSDECTRDLVWLTLRSLYLSEKTRFLNEEIDHSLNTPPSCPEPEFPMNMTLAFEQLGDGVGGLTYDQVMSFTGSTTPADVTNLIIAECEETCESYRDYWESKLVGCQLSSAQIVEILDYFEQICSCSCTQDGQSMGASDVSASCDVVNFPLTSFEDVLAQYGIITDPSAPTGFNPNCSASQISWPPSQQQTLSGVNQEESPGFGKLDQCACDLILQGKYEYSQSVSSAWLTLEEFFALEHGIQFVDLDALACDCEEAFKADYPSFPGVSWVPGVPWGTLAIDALANLGKVIPGEIGCEKCLVCDDVLPVISAIPTALLTHPNAPDFLSAYLNKTFGMNLTWWDYEEFYEICSSYTPIPCDYPDQVADLVTLMKGMIPDADVVGQGVDLSSYTEYTNSLLNYSASNTSCQAQPVWDSEPLFNRLLKQPFQIARTTFIVTKHEKNVVHTSRFNQTLGNNNPPKVSSWDEDHKVQWSVILGETLNNPTWHGDPYLKELADGRIVYVAFVSIAQADYLATYFIDPNNPTSLVFSDFPLINLGPISGDVWVKGIEEGINDKLYVSIGNRNFNSRIIILSTDPGNYGLVGGLEINLGQVLFGYSASEMRSFISESNGGYISGNYDPTRNELYLKWFDSNLNAVTGKDWKYVIPSATPDAKVRNLLLSPKQGGGVVVCLTFFNPDGLFYLIDINDNAQFNWGKAYYDVSSSYVSNNSYYDFLVDSDDHDIVVFSGQIIGDKSLLKIDGINGSIEQEYLTVAGIQGPPGAKLQEEGPNRYISLSGIYNVESPDRYIQRYKFDPVTGFESTCGEVPLNTEVEDLLVTQSTVSTGTPFIPSILSRQAQATASTSYFIPECPERLLIHYYDGCDVDCHVELTMPDGLAENASFAELTNMSVPKLHSDGSFSFAAEYTYQTTTHQFIVTGTSTCIDACPGEPMLCNQPLIPDVPYRDNCQEHLTAMAAYDAKMAYRQYKEEKLNEFKQEYLEACVDNANLAEEYTMEAPFHEYNFMLYHYDQAGNLTKTVAPKGTKGMDTYLTSGFNTPVNDSRENNNATVINRPFQYFTLYQYNSLNQLIYKFSKDEGESNYWYDELGRQILAQDAEQSHVGGLYSYVSYDALGRPVESGELDDQGQSFPAIVAKNNPTNYLTYSSYESWVTGGLKMEYSQTHYDEEATGPVLVQFGGEQTNLRNRVAYVSYYNPDAALDYEHHTYYSYDIQGNVHTLVHEYPELAFLDNQYKKITYDFDLVSGNVKQVNYQPGHSDRFVHRYQYDSDNRLVAAFTSPDSVFFDRDATYEYYLHGPLARVNLGEWDVQGIDYAYTIHGWLKGVNAETLDPTRDIGLDGLIGGGAHASTAKDAFGFALHYYQGDYTGIKTNPGSIDHFLTDDDVFFNFTHNSYNSPRSLYNGNIMMMQTALMDGANAPLPEQRMKYEYDQLHRIKAANAFQNTTLLSTNQWDLGAGQVNTKYQVLYAYDENGNMATLNRSGSTSANYFLRDRFNYQYYGQSNRLNYVIDIKGSAGPQDMDTQAAGNYQYYEDGNLKSDVLDNISQIHWNVANKIDRIEFTSGATGKPEEIQFHYDAMGERIVKLVKPDASDQATWTYTYYVRDAQGNVMATYDRTTIQPSATSVPPGNIDLTAAWSTFSSAEYFRLSEQHLYGSSRLGVLQTELALAIYTSEATPGLITNLPYWYSPFAPLPGDPCGCAPCANPPCDPCWCITPTCPGGQPCSGGTSAGCPTCYGVNWPTVSTSEAAHSIGVYTRGRKRYELSNHLGNVLAVISDRKLQIDGSVGSYNPDIWAYHDYYPFGMTLPDRSWQAEGYRYGFQGQEADDEVFGEDIAINYTFRMHDARIGRFLSIDPLAAKYPFWSPYAFSGNMVIQYRELEGLEPAMDGNEPGNYQVAGDQKNGGSFGWTWTGDDWRRGPEEVLMDESLPATKSKSKVKPKKSNFLGGIPLTTPKMNIDPAINRGVYSVTGGNNMQDAYFEIVEFSAKTGSSIGAIAVLGPVWFIKGAGINFSAQVAILSGIDLYQTGNISIGNILYNQVDYFDVAAGGAMGGVSSLWGQIGGQVLAPAMFDYTLGRGLVSTFGEKSYSATLIDGAFNFGAFGLSRAVYGLANSYTQEAARMMRINATIFWTEIPAGHPKLSLAALKYYDLTVWATNKWGELNGAATRSLNFNLGVDFSIETSSQAGSNYYKNK